MYARILALISVSQSIFFFLPQGILILDEPCSGRIHHLIIWMLVHRVASIKKS